MATLLRNGFLAAKLRTEARKSKDAPQAQRLLAIASAPNLGLGNRARLLRRARHHADVGLIVSE